MAKPHFMRIDNELKKELLEIKEKDNKRSISAVVEELIKKNKAHLKEHIREARK